MTEIHALSGAYAVDALDDLERAQFERHLAECAECRAEVASLREAAALLPEAHAVPPSAAVRDRVLGDIRTVRPLPPVVQTSTTPVRQWPRRLVAAAAVLLVLGVGVAIARPWSTGTPSTTDRVLQASDAVRVEKPLPGSGSITVVKSSELGRAVVMVRGLPAPPEGKAYEVWLEDDRGNMRPAGLIHTGGDHTMLMAPDSATAAGVGVTVEPAAGSDQPTLPPVALVTLGTA
ncbi:MAG: anti-sigma factor [Marmoricola sp.]